MHVWQLSSHAAVDYYGFIKWHSPSVSLAAKIHSTLTQHCLSWNISLLHVKWKNKNTPDTSWTCRSDCLSSDSIIIRFVTVLILYCGFVVWLLCSEGFFFSSCVFVWLMWFFFLLHAQLLSLLVHSFVLKQVENTFSDQLSLSTIAQTHLSPGKGTINGPKPALFTPAKTIIVNCFSYISLGNTKKVHMDVHVKAAQSCTSLIRSREGRFENLTLVGAISQLTQSLSFRPCWSAIGVWSLIRG